MKEKAMFSWSGGKDSALAFYEIQKNYNLEVLCLLTTFTKDYGRTSLHGVRRILIEQQAESLGFHLEKVFISKKSPLEEYEAQMRAVLVKYQKLDVSSVVFGDIFLEDVRKYREDNLMKMGMKGIFPLWKRNTYKLVHAFIDLGFKGVIICVDSKVLDKKYVGRIFDEQFLSELPSSVDPCGENGEFHSFVFDGPIFHKRTRYRKGKTVFKENRFFYLDLIPLFSNWRTKILDKSQ